MFVSADHVQHLQFFISQFVTVEGTSDLARRVWGNFSRSPALLYVPSFVPLRLQDPHSEQHSVKHYGVDSDFFISILFWFQVLRSFQRCAGRIFVE